MLAERVESSWRVYKSVPAAAKRHDPEVQVDHDAGITFYHFQDGSVLGTKGRGNRHQIWMLPPIEGGWK